MVDAVRASTVDAALRPTVDATAAAEATHLLGLDAPPADAARAELDLHAAMQRQAMRLQERHRQQ